LKLDESSGGMSFACPANTRPVEPSTVIHSPCLIARPLIRNSVPSTFTSMSWAPATHGVPIPRATTAA
jgi:hypothetical protein